jgi:Flp pilus assembly protein TadG
VTGRERGQALVEAVLAVPVCITAALTIVDCGVLVRDRLAVTDAAGRAAAATLHGDDAAEAARAALPASVRDGARVTVDGDRVRVAIQSSTHIPGVAHLTQVSDAVATGEVAR